MDEKILISRLKSKDSDVLGEIIELYSCYIKRIVTNMNKNGGLTQEDMEEIAADVFVSLWNNADKIDASINTLKYYIGVITRNKVKDRWRTSHLWNIPLNDDILTIDRLETDIDRKEKELIVAELLGNLCNEDKDIFINYYYNCRSVQEISDETGLNISTVKSRLKRGRQKLKHIIERGENYAAIKNF